ncbi:hypothetical protein HRI_000008900 [Hibiscus trionum]|uniref:Uncharacterized protein n=1 Tax=Hibiscus trionum TaxID=183268 RepID=A0A9W7LGM6_HIBTR|nr:hypothetical protein HRI_000008900 [Hibiscus trionum]
MYKGEEGKRTCLGERKLAKKWDGGVDNVTNHVFYPNNNPIYTLKHPTKIFTFPTPKIAPRRSRISCSAHPTPPRRLSQIVFRKSGDERFASISSSSNQQTSSVVVNPYPIVPPPSSQMVAAFLDWSRCWALSTFYMGGFKLKEICNAASFQNNDGPDEYTK